MDMGAYLYSLLPGSMRDRDQASTAPLQQLCAVLGAGLAGVRSDADAFPSLVDVETCPVSQLSRLAAMLGFDFPFDLPEDQQRAFTRSAVSLYRVKGTPQALTAVVSRIIGSGFQLAITSEDWVAKTFTLSLTAVQDNASLTAFENKLVYLVGLYSPAGLIPAIVTAYYYTDVAPSAQRADAVATTERDAWRCNHNAKLNTIQANGDIDSLNNYGTTALTI